jgi:hypothetical protein
MNNQERNRWLCDSATNERDVKLVQTSDGKPIKIKYQPEAYYQSNIESICILADMLLLD